MMRAWVARDAPMGRKGQVLIPGSGMGFITASESEFEKQCTHWGMRGCVERWQARGVQ